MDGISMWALGVSCCAVMTCIAEILTADSGFDKIVRFVLGGVLLSVVILPLGDVLSEVRLELPVMDGPAEARMKNDIEEAEKDYLRSQLEELVVATLNENGIKPGEVRVNMDIDDDKRINIITAEVCPDHVHMFVEIPPKLSVSSFMGYLKGKSSVMIYQKWGNMKFKYRNRSFWCRGYYVDTAGKNAVVITKYIENQLKEDKSIEQLTLDKIDPFTGNKR